MKEYTIKVDDDGTKYWYLNGNLHREGGPACEYPNGTKIWYLNGNLHREDGPAIEYPSGHKFWYLNGTNYTEEEFWNKVNPGKHLSINLDGFQSAQFQFQPVAWMFKMTDYWEGEQVIITKTTQSKDFAHQDGHYDIVPLYTKP